MAGVVRGFDLHEPTIGALWSRYRAEVLEPSGIVGGVQLQESRRIFYAACGLTMQLAAQIPRNLDHAEAERVLLSMLQETVEFMEKVMQDEPGY